MPHVTDQKPRALDLLARMGSGELYRQAYSRGQNLSVWLEEQDPSDGYKDGLDAFGRLMKAAGIATRSDVAVGLHADTFDAFDKTAETRGLVPEWMARQWRRAVTGRDVSTRSLFTTVDNGPGTVMQPFVDAAQARYKQLAPAIPLDEMVAITTPIDGDAYRAFYLIDDPASERRVRVAQGAEVPRAKIVGADHTIRLKKFGRALEATYEILRRQRIDMVALTIARMAIQAETDKVAAAIDVLVNGDGNSLTAATNYNLTALDATATAGLLTLRGWLNYKLQFPSPYALTTAIAQAASVLQAMLLNTGSANIPLVAIQGAGGFGGFRAINPSLADNVAIGWTVDAPVMKIVGFDARLALQQVFEVGGDITEVERFVARQTNILVMTEVQGFAVLDQNATRVLSINA